MGFSGHYKILSPVSWDVSIQKPAQENNSSSGGGSKQQKVVDFVKKWLLCGGWMFDSSEYSPVISPGKNRSSSSPGGGADGYVKPPRWKQFLRRVRARSKKMQNACCEGLCFHPQQQPLNYCSTDSYERNFDRGRESWEDYALFSCKSPSPAFAAAPLDFSGSLKPAGSATPILWESRPVDHLFVASPIAVAAR